jgi:cysteine desulfurase
MPKDVYLDNAAATPIDPRVTRAMVRAYTEAGNPSAFNAAGRRARARLETARIDVARFLNARSDEVVFCASGSEANNLAISGVGDAITGRGNHVVATPIEHLSVLGPVRQLVRRSWKASMVPVDGFSRVTAEDVAKLLKAKTRLVSVMYANNEIGTVQPIKAIARVIRDWRRAHRTPYPYFHVDACQATTTLPMDVQALGVDLLTLNGAKAHGPRGAAALFVRRGIVVKPQVLGGNQEFGFRAGTEDVASAVGLATALGLIKKEDGARVAGLRDYFLGRLSDILPDARLNGPVGRERLANNINISIPGVSSEGLLLELDRYGMRAGAGSACTAHHVEPSHVLVATGTPRRFLSGALRFSLSRMTTKADVERLIQVLPKVVAAVRRRSLPAGRQA